MPFYAKDLGFGTAAKVKSRKGFRSDSFVIGGSYPVGGGKTLWRLQMEYGKMAG